MKIILVALVSASGFFASAQTAPSFEPGPVMKLNAAANEAVDALLMAKSSDLKSFIKSGNVTKEVSRQNYKPGVTVYNFTRKECNLGGITGGMCLGGSVLQVVVSKKQSGSMVTIEATSSTNLIK
ncbi:MAG: hypothetical protein H7235_05780 [Bdellovibrionaceae bacterium]|nr:hypothetical protein [Pseudobdellovibrionaceae bacterium]